MFAPTEILRVHFSHLCPSPCAIAPVRGADINSTNYIVHPEGAAGPAFILKCKILKDAASVEAMSRRLAWQKWAADREPLAPKLMVTSDGDLMAVEGLATYRLFEYRRGGPFPNSAQALEEAGRALGRLHVALRGVGDRNRGHSLYEPLSSEEVVQAHERLRSGEVEEPFAGSVAEWLRSEAGTLFAEEEQLESDLNLPVGCVHGDFHPGNVLFEGDKVSAILDLDSLVTDFRMQAVVFGAIRFAALNDEERVRRFLRAYHEVDALTVEELHLIPGFARREPLRRIRWIVRMNVLERGNVWRGDFEKHLRAIEASKTLDAISRNSDGDLLTWVLRPF